MKKLDIIFGVTFIILALVCTKFYPVNLRVADHIKLGYSGLLLFFGAYFLSK